MLLPTVYYIMFCYYPMFGILVAFKNYMPKEGTWGSPWYGLRYMRMIFDDMYFWRVFVNTITLNLTNLIISFPAPVIFALLSDALERAKKDPETAPIASRMTLFPGDSIPALPTLTPHPDVVLLDPMFPERTKSALVKKKFQLLHQLERPCENEAALLDAALAARPKRVVIKRPAKGPYLAGVKPSYSLSGSAVRFDCVIP